MTNGIELQPGHKFINPGDPSEGQVPESVTFGKDFRGACYARIAVACKFGNSVTFDYHSTVIGERATVGNYVSLKADEVGDRVTIGSDCVIGIGCKIEDDVWIGQHVIIGPRVVLKHGVVVPSHWEIPYGYIVNPGPNGTPVLVAPPYPQVSCNVTAVNRY